MIHLFVFAALMAAPVFIGVPELFWVSVLFGGAAWLTLWWVTSCLARIISAVAHMPPGDD